MLKNLPKLLSPELLKCLSEMGHGDEVVIADANYPATTLNAKVIRADGISATMMLEAVLKVIPLDTYANENLVFMETTNGDPTPKIWKEFLDIANKADKNVKNTRIPKGGFYDRSKKSSFIIQTGEERIYGNVIVKKGLIK